MSNTSPSFPRGVPTRRVTAVNDFVGKRMRERRIDLGLTSNQLAEKIDLSFQQLLKYERGAHRISAGQLYAVARVLNTPITYFYEGFDDEKAGRVPAQRGRSRQFEMARHLDGIDNEQHLEAINLVARALAGS
jgi:transcriptional regulator with XRE-family HTH domain